jgi:uncharacterized membrane protein
MMFDGMWGWHWMGMAFFWLAPVVIIGLLALGISRWPIKRNNQADEAAIDILEKLYAKGEINDQEFERRKKALSHA